MAHLVSIVVRKMRDDLSNVFCCSQEEKKRSLYSLKKSSAFFENVESCLFTLNNDTGVKSHSMAS